MKLATYRDGSRDGQLVVVSRDLGQAHYATGIADRLAQVLDDWNFLAPQLQDLYAQLNAGRARHAFAFDARQCMAPLPRAGQRLGALAYPSHAGRVRRAWAVALPELPATMPVLYQGAGDDLLGACDDVCLTSEALAADLGASLMVVTGDVARGALPEQALEGVRLLMLANEVTLTALAADELARGLGLVQARAATACSPVAVTPDELGDAWRGGRVRLTLKCSVNGRKLGLVDAGAGMRFDFGQLLAHAARTRRLRAGSLLGADTVSSDDPARGFCSIAEKRVVEALDGSEPVTGYLRFGDVVRVEMLGSDGTSVFGAIEHAVAQAGA